MSSSPLAWINDELASLERQKLRRRLVTREGPQGARVVLDGREYINFGSNDYLALAGDRRLAAAAIAAIRQQGVGSGASPLITGRSEAHRQLEARLAEFEGTEAALVFPSGYAANVGAITALVGSGDVVFCDAKNHASLWDGCRLSRADVRAYPHADVDQLELLLSHATTHRRRLIVTDSLFSMDGDVAPLRELADVAHRCNAMLLIDEAHATGVLGKHGRGAAELLGVEDRVAVRIGTLSKALGCSGGFVVGSRQLIDWLVNRARPYIYSTASSPAVAAAAVAAIDIVVRKPQRREDLLESSAMLRGSLAAQGWALGPSTTQIIPVVVGEADRAIALSARLRSRGLLVPAIRPPTVPEGEACLRVSVTADHAVPMIARLIEAMRQAAISRPARSAKAGRVETKSSRERSGDKNVVRWIQWMASEQPSRIHGTIHGRFTLCSRAIVGQLVLDTPIIPPDCKRVCRVCQKAAEAEQRHQ